MIFYSTLYIFRIIQRYNIFFLEKCNRTRFTGYQKGTGMCQLNTHSKYNHPRFNLTGMILQCETVYCELSRCVFCETMQLIEAGFRFIGTSVAAGSHLRFCRNCIVSILSLPFFNSSIYINNF